MEKDKCDEVEKLSVGGNDVYTATCVSACVFMCVFVNPVSVSSEGLPVFSSETLLYLSVFTVPPSPLSSPLPAPLLLCRSTLQSSPTRAC